MIMRGNKCETRWPGLMSSVADGSTYSAPVVEAGSSCHSSRIANATSSPLTLSTANGGRREGERSSPDLGDSLRVGHECSAEVIEHAELGEDDCSFWVAVEALDLAVDQFEDVA